MFSQCYLGVDLGAESGRVMAGLFDGAKIELIESHRFPNVPVTIHGSIRWDVLRLWSEIQNGLSQAQSQFGQSIRSLGVDTWGVDYVLLSKTGEMLGQPFHYRDSRTDGMMEHAFARVPRAEIFSNTGLQFLPFNTLYQLLAMQNRTPELMNLADTILLMPDFFHWCLCGSRVVESTNATTSQCFHPQENDWAWEMLRKFDLPTNMFPEVVPPGTNLGHLRKDVAESSGLGRIPVVAPATHDTGSAVVAVPTRNTGSPNWAYISSGTWSLIGAEVTKPILTTRASQWNFTNEGGVDGTYRLLKNVMGLWLVQQCKKAFEKKGNFLKYDRLIQLAEESPPFQAIVDPDDPAFLNPSDMPAAIAEVCRKNGQDVPRTEGAFVRCALESLALKYRLVLDWLEELTGTKLEVVHIVGGGSQNRLLNQFTANACGRPVMAGPVESTALGNVLVQARAAGEIGSLEEIRDVVRRSFECQEYQPEDASLWTAVLEKYRASL